ncbi:restriction endonuclease [Kiloniella litopenaei]|uniref:Restriction endonuclease n=1 Tax=Kiloniella litopenaei TaxID=1549748 RepID=A0A0M2RCC0_9PROT|nr:HNH endonuclease [Kiloniella litopenaei]KKJ77228.1 restriction endonuclease [Kiloniella litopenaei]
MAERRNWSQEEVRHALALYLVTDFGKIDNKNPDIIKLANALGRSKNAVALKLANLAALDASIPQSGMSNVSKTDRQVWDEFKNDPSAIIEAYEEQSLDKNHTIIKTDTDRFINETLGLAETDTNFDPRRARDKQVFSKQRVGQNFFRKAILSAYERRCALTGVEDIRLLNASHIVAWKDDHVNRVNPSNGICLNGLHDRAFDRHLITFDEDYRLKIRNDVPQIARRQLERVESSRLYMPKRFLPDQAFLEQHRRIFYEEG